MRFQLPPIKLPGVRMLQRRLDDAVHARGAEMFIDLLFSSLLSDAAVDDAPRSSCNNTVDPLQIASLRTHTTMRMRTTPSATRKPHFPTV
jgi:hypothetical protein